MSQWWAGLGAWAQGFYIAAVFFSVIFVWQFLMAIIGLGGDHDVDADTGADADHDFDADHDLDSSGHVDGAETDGHDAAESLAAFKLLSLRSVLAFCMLFSWAGGLYLQAGKKLTVAFLYATIWGLTGMVLVAITLYLLRKMAHTGTMNLRAAVGQDATVYLDIPAGGTGEIRVMVNDTMQNLKARGRDAAKKISAGSTVKVVSINSDILIVE